MFLRTLFERFCLVDSLSGIRCKIFPDPDFGLSYNRKEISLQHLLEGQSDLTRGHMAAFPLSKTISQQHNYCQQHY